jgi:hypothetical protein
MSLNLSGQEKYDRSVIVEEAISMVVEAAGKPLYYTLKFIEDGSNHTGGEISLAYSDSMKEAVFFIYEDMLDFDPQDSLCLEKITRDVCHEVGHLFFWGLATQALELATDKDMKIVEYQKEKSATDIGELLYRLVFGKELGFDPKREGNPTSKEGTSTGQGQRTT